ncbi:hypothetical protein C8R43DRAFT_989366 [Mycena crocata]|nr:hypothetical protein C8R43DRAFT_989366 [Mycena crocata]
MSTIRTACVTGAAQGIGRAIALRLAADGCTVAVSDLPCKIRILEDLVDHIQSKFGAKSVAITADVTDEGEVDNLIAGTVQRLGGLDVFVANAGVATLDNILDTSIEEWERVHAVNVTGTFVCYKAAAKAMIAQGRGGIIIGASSLAATKGADMSSVYGSSSAVRAMTQSAAQEWSQHRIRVNAIASKATYTSLLSDTSVGPSNVGTIMDHRAAVGTAGTPEAIAGVVSILASKDCDFMTGQILSTDGGVWFE